MEPRVLRKCVATVAGWLLRLSARRAGITLVYHGLAVRTGDTDLELVAPHGVDLFEAEMRHISRTYRLVSAADVLDAAARRRRGERFPIAVTFDDDLASHVSLALPILRRTGVNATFFLTGATLQGPFSFWWQRLQLVAADEERLVGLFASVGAEPPVRSRYRMLHELSRLVERLEPGIRETFVRKLPDASGDSRNVGLSAESIRTLIDAGMSIGFHTRGHNTLIDLDDEDLAAAFEEGRRELEEVVGHHLTLIAYPHGRADERVAAMAVRAGFDVGFTGTDRAVQGHDNVLLLGRLSPSHRSAGHLALQIVAALFRARDTD
jgi:peptidoglycan/xylan/chitin deacetylase (PgdA/CDA1 family)